LSPSRRWEILAHSHSPFFETGSELLASSDPPASAFPGAGSIGMCPTGLILNYSLFFFSNSGIELMASYMIDMHSTVEL
jgi:hypothetical protein